MKTCRICKEKYKPFSTISRTCSIKCAILDSKQIAQKKSDKAFNKRKLEFKANDVKLRKTTAQTAFNAYIRKRDELNSCISCDKPNDGSHQRHASHFRSVGACSALRFDETNVHASCAQCNGMKSGNIGDYRIRLIQKIGVENVEWLESQNQIVRYSCDDLKSIELKYKRKLKKIV